jgi:hypothetical protein
MRWALGEGQRSSGETVKANTLAFRSRGLCGRRAPRSRQDRRLSGTTEGRRRTDRGGCYRLSRLLRCQRDTEGAETGQRPVISGAEPHAGGRWSTAVPRRPGREAVVHGARAWRPPSVGPAIPSRWPPTAPRRSGDRYPDSDAHGPPLNGGPSRKRQAAAFARVRFAFGAGTGAASTTRGLRPSPIFTANS